MVIYGEYLFMENALTGYLIFALTARLCGFHPKQRRLILGGTLCGIYSFIIFLEWLPSLLALLSKLAFSGISVSAVFGPQKVNPFFRTVVVFYLVSFAVGGITIGGLYFTGSTGVSNNTSLYLTGISYVNIMTGCLAAYIILRSFAGFIQTRFLRESVTAQVDISINGKSITLPAILDTGNFLTEPISGKPVYLIELTAFLTLVEGKTAEILMQEESASQAYCRLSLEEPEKGWRLIPFSSVGKEKGMLLGVRPDQIIVRRDGVDSVGLSGILGIFRGSFGMNREEEHYSVLLHSAAMEGGIMGHA